MSSLHSLCLVVCLCLISYEVCSVYSMPSSTNDNDFEDPRIMDKLKVLLRKMISTNNWNLNRHKPTIQNLDDVVDNDGSAPSYKRGFSDMVGVLPPWNEFCRQFKLNNCYRSNYQ